MDVIEISSDTSSVSDDEPGFVEVEPPTRFFEEAYAVCMENRQLTSRDPRSENLWPWYYAASLAHAKAEKERWEARIRQLLEQRMNGTWFILPSMSPESYELEKENHLYLMSIAEEASCVNPADLQLPPPIVYEEIEDLAGEIVSPVDITDNAPEVEIVPPIDNTNNVPGDDTNNGPKDNTNNVPDCDVLLPSIEVDEYRTPSPPPHSPMLLDSADWRIFFGTTPPWNSSSEESQTESQSSQSSSSSSQSSSSSPSTENHNLPPRSPRYSPSEEPDAESSSPSLQSSSYSPSHKGHTSSPSGLYNDQHDAETQDATHKTQPSSRLPQVQQEGSEQSSVVEESPPIALGNAVETPLYHPQAVQAVDEQHQAPSQQPPLEHYPPGFIYPREPLEYEYQFPGSVHSHQQLEYGYQHPSSVDPNQQPGYGNLPQVGYGTHQQPGHGYGYGYGTQQSSFIPPEQQLGYGHQQPSFVHQVQQPVYGYQHPNFVRQEQQPVYKYLDHPTQPTTKSIKSRLRSKPQIKSEYSLPQEQPIASFPLYREQAPSVPSRATGQSDAQLAQSAAPWPDITHLVQTPNLANALLNQPFTPQSVNTHLAPHLIDRPSTAATAKMENTAPTSKGDGTTRGEQEAWTDAERQLLRKAATQWWHWKDNNTLSRGSSTGAALYRYFEFIFAEAGLSRSYYQLKNQWSRNERAKFGRSEQRGKKDGTARDLITSARPSAKAKVEAEVTKVKVEAETTKAKSITRKRMHTVIVDDEDDEDDYAQDDQGPQHKQVRRF